MGRVHERVLQGDRTGLKEMLRAIEECCSIEFFLKGVDQHGKTVLQSKAALKKGGLKKIKQFQQSFEKNVDRLFKTVS